MHVPPVLIEKFKADERARIERIIRGMSRTIPADTEGWATVDVVATVDLLAAIRQEGDDA